MKFFIRILTICLVFFTHINAEERTVDELSKLIAGLDNLEIPYFFWTKNNNTYLANKKDDGTLGVWFYTASRKWQPIHNAEAFDGFPAVVKSFQSTIRDAEKETITFSSVIDGSVAGIPLEKAKLLEGTIADIGWYFWLQNGDAFLFKKVVGDEIRIWYYTSDRKWQPIHNAAPFDGFKEAPKTLESTSFNTAQGTLSTGQVISNNETVEPDKSRAASYELVFNATWSKETHPTNFPPSPVFSPPIGGLHNDKVKIWEVGSISRSGIQLVAEKGSLDELKKYMQGNTNINLIIEGPWIMPSPNKISLSFEVNSSFPYLSLASKLGPSPDWFVGLSSLNLLDEDGAWINEKTIDLILYDAGTNSAEISTASKVATSPKERIKAYTSPDGSTDFKDGKPFVGQIIITKQ